MSKAHNKRGKGKGTRGKKTQEGLPPKSQNIGELFEQLVQVMATLRGPNGCPWDKAQNHESIKRNTIEEAYEVASAIEEKNSGKLLEELGDLLLQVIFHAQMASEAKQFDITDVVRDLVRKLINRHPHVFGEKRVETPEQALAQWENIKRNERSQIGSLMDGLAWSLPSLMLAHHAQKRAAQVGFDWDDPILALQKLKEETAEVEVILERDRKNKQRLEEEIGDLLFAAVNVARLSGVDAEMALRHSVRKFVKRFKAIEGVAKRQGKNLAEMSLSEMDEIWESIKEGEQQYG
ncbi:MAG: nucleoside triphosphate pyrophosphohydrolase [Armatimonadetes bacterium]|nr:nucleoside triphosphate pyrophosphohydrolase [Armatimonadota bacterium]